MSSNRSIKQIFLSLGLIAVTCLAFFCTYYFKLSYPVKIIIWIFWLLSFGVIGYFTSKGQQVFAFALDAKAELLKVVWPTRQETVQTTSIVMVMVTVTGFILWGIDSGMMWLIAKITHLG